MKIDEVKHHRGTYAWGGLWGILMLVCLLVPTTAVAHKVTVFAWVEGNTVHTESKFSGGRVAKDSRIEVYDTEGQKLLEGRTDDQGRFTFQPPRQEALRIVLIAGTGHRNEWRVAAEEFTDAPSAPPASVTAGTMPQPSSTGQAESGTLKVSPVELQALIEQALDRKLAPIMHRLVALDKGPSLSDIIGGIGYIIGLVGLASYIHSRRKFG